MRHLPPLSAALLLGLSCPALAQTDVEFLGAVLNTCLVVVTPGVMFLNGDGDVLSSSPNGTAATASIVSIGPNTIELSDPELLTWPPGYSTTNQTVKLQTTGLFDRLFGTEGFEFDVGLLSAQILAIDLEIANEDGFAQGAYTARTVLTCS